MYGMTAQRYADLAVSELEESKRRSSYADADRDIERAKVYARLAQAAALA